MLTHLHKSFIGLLFFSILSCDPDTEPQGHPDFPFADTTPGQIVFLSENYTELSVVNDQQTGQITNSCENACYKKGARWISNGEKISYIMDGKVNIINKDGTMNQVIIAQSRSSLDAAFSGDGKFLANASAYVDLYAVDDNFLLQYISATGNIPAAGLAWSPDGKKVFIESAYFMGLWYEHGIYTISTNEFKTISNARLLHYSWSKDSDKIVLQTEEDIVLYDVINEEMEMISPGTTIKQEIPTWSPANNQLAFIEEGNRIRLYDDDTYTITTLFDDPETVKIHYLEWSSDGKSIAFSMEYGPHEGIYLLNIDKAEITKLSDEEAYSFDWYSQ